tara:strand:+ start:168 stop:716 length:549 start_codon:yes stop_codon:yes gene_type:complete
MIKKKSTKIEGLYIVQNLSHEDNRGSFRELWNKHILDDIQLDCSFNQDNISISKKEVIRGLHFQNNPHEQLKYVQVIQGSILDIAVDIRKQSLTFGQHIALEISDKNNMGLWIPKGFAHGFLALKDNTIVTYKCAGKYSKKHEQTIKWNDPDLNIKWGINNPIISTKDDQGISFKDYINIQL